MAAGLILCSVVVTAQTSVPSSYRGQEAMIARGVLDGNLIETNFRNHGEVSRWNDTPWGNWPRGIGGRHVDGIGMLVTGIVPGNRTSPGLSEFYGNVFDTTLNPIIMTYRSAGLRTGPNGSVWGWLPLPGFHKVSRLDPITGRLSPVPALSNDPSSWPDFWPDRLGYPDDPGWAGQWNGLFGKGILNADLESFYVIDDLSDDEYAIDPNSGIPYSQYGVYYPDPADSTKGGLGMQTEVRLLQWSNVLAEDTMFLLYRITNVGAFDHRRLWFGQITDYGLGQEEGDENAAFNPQLDVAYGWDQDGIGTRETGGVYDLGYSGFAFLESPARCCDGVDNDEDGITDESRFDGPGVLVEGQAAIRSQIESVYNVANFTAFNSLTGFESFNDVLLARPAYRAGRWWTGDENLDWIGWEDQNGNGEWELGEPYNNDVGLDGIGPFDLGYVEPDEGEVDGIPTGDEKGGEPNFDVLDVDESDQIGLTGFDLDTRPFYESGDNLRSDTWLWERIVLAESKITPGTKPADFVADVEPFILFTSGQVQLPPQTTDFFSTAWLFGANEEDFFKNRRTVQQIYNADYNFAQPPFTPRLSALAGDGKVTLSWDTTSTVSFDRFSQEFDFEGYRLYRGTDPLLSDARLITDLNGAPTFYRPLKQWDLQNSIRGPIPVLGGDAVYDLGRDTGLEFFYVDEDVTNGITYYYAIVAYDRGFDDPDNPSTEPIDPQENTFNVSVDLAGNVIGTSPNAAVVTPRSTAAGFVEAATVEDLSQLTSGTGSGAADVRIVDESLLRPGDTYRVSFFDTTSADGDLYTTSAYSLQNLTTNETLINRRPFEVASPAVEGFIVEFANDTEIDYKLERTGWVSNEGSANVQYSLDPRELDGYQTNWLLEIKQDTTPSYAATLSDFEITWVDAADSTYRSPRFGIGRYLRIDVPIFVRNVTLNRPVDFFIEDYNRNDTLDAGDELLLAFREAGGLGQFKFRHRVRFRLPPGESAGVGPSAGSKIRISSRRPFATGDFFQFTLKSSEIDAGLAESELDEIRVVPNPYVAAAAWEPRSQIVGRGARQIQFTNLPAECVIKVFNLRGELLKTLVHNGLVGGGGSKNWDLRTEGGQDLAFGVYIFHVDAPGVGEHVGKFAIVK